jgi:hypothetical protein
MTKFVRFLTANDKPAVQAAMIGVPCRLKVIRNGIRIVITVAYDRQSVADALNNAGFMASGGAAFNVHSVANGEIFVRHAP